MSTCIIRQLLYEHSEIDALPSLTPSSRHDQTDEEENDEDDETSYGEENDSEDEGEIEKDDAQPDWDAISKDLSTADPEQVIACDVLIFLKIAKRMPSEQLMALLRGAREHALATKDETKFRQLASVMPASSLLLLLREITDTVQDDRRARGIAATEEDEDDTTTRNEDDSTMPSGDDEDSNVGDDDTDTSQVEVEGDETVKEGQTDASIEATGPFRTTAAMLPLSSPVEPPAKLDRCVSFRAEVRVHSIERVEKSPELWWEKVDMRRIRQRCTSIVEHYAYSQEGWEYIETLSNLLNDPDASDSQYQGELDYLAKHPDCRGLERHINEELHDLGSMHRMNVLHSQKEYKEQAGSSDPLNYWESLAEAASETSYLYEQFAIKLAIFDRRQADMIAV